MVLRAIWQFIDRDVTHKILYGPEGSWCPYTILWVTDQSINCYLARSAMNYLLYYTQYMQICQTTCFCYCISKTKNEFGQNPEENIILIGLGQYTKILTGQYTKLLTGCANKDKYINTWAFPYWPGYHHETPILARDAVEGQYGNAHVLNYLLHTSDI
jgi:hypothetical protein